MIVAFRETIEIDATRKADIFAFAGSLNVFMHGMTMRDAVKAIMAVKGTTWYKDLEALYPVNETYLPRKRSPRKPKAGKADSPVVKGTAGIGKEPAKAKSA